MAQVTKWKQRLRGWVQHAYLLVGMGLIGGFIYIAVAGRLGLGHSTMLFWGFLALDRASGRRSGVRMWKAFLATVPRRQESAVIDLTAVPPPSKSDIKRAAVIEP